jgi:RHS repeat-associated protein
LTEDALGSVRAITDSNGQIKARRDFLPFGEELYSGIGTRNTNQKYSANGDDTRKKFATYQRDAETNLDFAQLRYYSPMQGRFTSPDEFKGGPDELFDFEEDASDNPTFYAELDNPQSLNKYQYDYNNPYKYNDPTGHNPWWLLRAIPAAIAVVKVAADCIKNNSCRQVAKDVVKGILNRIPVIGSIPVKEAVKQSVKKGASNPKVADAIKKGKQKHKEFAEKVKKKG